MYRRHAQVPDKGGEIKDNQGLAMEQRGEGLLKWTCFGVPSLPDGTRKKGLGSGVKRLAIWI